MVGCVLCNTRVDPSLIGNECPYDDLGFFIVNGNEKVIVNQEKLRPNHMFVRQLHLNTISLEVRSLHESKIRSTSTFFMNINTKSSGHDMLTGTIPFIDTNVHLAGIFNLLGFACKEELFHLFEKYTGSHVACRDRILSVVSMLLSSPQLIAHREALIEQIGKAGTKEPTHARRNNYVVHIIINELLPHIGMNEDYDVRRRKVIYIIFCSIKILRVYFEEIPVDDRDDFSVKRLDTTGNLFSLLFRQLFRNFLKLLNLQLSRVLENNKFINVVDCINPKKITQNFKYALSTGIPGSCVNA
jgi:DNA-directed RNA polymerase II subunit RPB2